MSATGSLLVVYDDASFAALIAASKTRRGRLDIEALTRSSDEEIFDGAFLEGVQSAAVGTPRVSSLIWARPEKVAQLLISTEPLLAAFSKTCLVIDGDCGDELAQLKMAGIQTAIDKWDAVVTNALANRVPPRSVGWSEAGADVINRFRVGIAAGLRQNWSEEVGFLGQLPRIARKIGLILNARDAHASESIIQEQVEAAVGLAQRSIAYRKRIVENYGEAVAKAKFQQDCAMILQKVTAHGPISGRMLTKHCHTQKMAPVLKVLEHLLHSGRIVKIESLYDIPRQEPNSLHRLSGT
jgi:hypothetical protein